MMAQKAIYVLTFIGMCSHCGSGRGTSEVTNELSAGDDEDLIDAKAFDDKKDIANLGAAKASSLAETNAKHEAEAMDMAEKMQVAVLAEEKAGADADGMDASETAEEQPGVDAAAEVPVNADTNSLSVFATASSLRNESLVDVGGGKPIWANAYLLMAKKIPFGKSISRAFGAYHVSVEFGSFEFSYGGRKPFMENPTGAVQTGVYSFYVKPNHEDEDHIFYKRVKIGETTTNVEDSVLEDLVIEVYNKFTEHPDWDGRKYNILYKNCITFSQAFLEALGKSLKEVGVSVELDGKPASFELPAFMTKTLNRAKEVNSAENFCEVFRQLCPSSSCASSAAGSPSCPLPEEFHECAEFADAFFECDEGLIEFAPAFLDCESCAEGDAKPTFLGSVVNFLHARLPQGAVA